MINSCECVALHLWRSNRPLALQLKSNSHVRIFLLVMMAVYYDACEWMDKWIYVCMCFIPSRSSQKPRLRDQVPIAVVRTDATLKSPLVSLSPVSQSSLLKVRRPFLLLSSFSSLPSPPFQSLLPVRVWWSHIHSYSVVPYTLVLVHAKRISTLTTYTRARDRWIACILCKIRWDYRLLHAEELQDTPGTPLFLSSLTHLQQNSKLKSTNFW